MFATNPFMMHPRATPFYYNQDPYYQRTDLEAELAARREAERRARRAAAKKVDRRKKLIERAHAAATTIQTAYRGHHVRHQTAALLKERAIAVQALREAEQRISEIMATHGTASHATPTKQNFLVASELLMRELLRLDELSLPQLMDVRDMRRQLVKRVSTTIERFDELAAHMSGAESLSERTSDDEEMQDAEYGADSGCVDVQALQATIRELEHENERLRLALRGPRRSEHR